MLKRGLLLKKTEGPVKSMEYFGLTRHTEPMSVKIPEETIKELLKRLNEDAFFLKITLKQLQSLCDSLAFRVSLSIFTIGTTPQRYQYKVLSHN
jgi:hypothetical protein